MKHHFTISAVMLILAACGSEPTEAPAKETASEKDAPRETASAPADRPGMMPPAPELAEDGDIFRASVGDEISVKFELPVGVGTSHMWQLQDNAWPTFLSLGNIWTSFEGDKRYNDVIINADAEGEADLTFVRYADGMPTDETRTVTVVVD